MEYKIDIYKTDEGNTLRYALGKNGKKPLVVIGLNPSTADEHNTDKTIEKVMGIADGAILDGFIMLNLYPQRTPKLPYYLDLQLNTKYHEKNLEIIKEVLFGMNDIQVLVAYGDNIVKLNRPYLKQCMKEIVSVISKFNPRWLKTGDLTQLGHPRNPLFVKYIEGLTEFDMETYLSKI